MRDILTAASAAGVAVAFGSPIGGVMFSIEVRSSSYELVYISRPVIGNESIIQYQDDVEELPLCPRGNCDAIGLCRDKVQSRRADILLHQAMNPFRTGKLVLFQVTYGRDWHFFEIMFFVILGIFGVLATGFPFFSLFRS